MTDKITRIYFDMDGVLADFNRGVKELCHMEPIPQGSGRAADDRLWNAVRKVPHFYGRLEPIEGSLQMFGSLYREYGDVCEILTGIPKPYRKIEGAGEDKIRWAHRFLSPRVKVNIVYREQKPQYCQGAGDILIDDFWKNIHAWEETGGTGILFVTPQQALQEMRKIAGEREREND